MVIAPEFESINDVLTPAFAVTFVVLIANGLVQLVPIDPAVADNITVPAVTTSPVPVIIELALFALRL
jgi:hypothetical protein